MFGSAWRSYLSVELPQFLGAQAARRVFRPMDYPPTQNPRWFDEEVHAHQASLRAYLRRAFPWIADPDDLVQDAMARLWKASRSGGVRSGKAFLFATARNAAVDLARHNAVVPMERLEDLPALSVLDDRLGVAETVSRREELELLAEAIRVLPDRCRQVLTLRKIYGLSQKEIASRLGISEHTVEVHTANGMRRCARFMREHGLMPSAADES